MDKRVNTSMNAELAKLFKWNVEDQYVIARKLAINCGYKLIPEDDEKSLQIKGILLRMENNGSAVSNDGDRDLLIQGLKALLK